jgi:Asp-tRNA(Asn)/Glu-tRNA(Gln) amidotransferase A subunit family amidase
MKGYETNVINKGVVAKMDATLVEKLKKKVQLLSGKTSMHEIGFW